jgi:hypothetical protein
VRGMETIAKFNASITWASKISLYSVTVNIVPLESPHRGIKFGYSMIRPPNVSFSSSGGIPMVLSC